MVLEYNPIPESQKTNYIHLLKVAFFQKHGKSSILSKTRERRFTTTLQITNCPKKKQFPVLPLQAQAKNTASLGTLLLITDEI